MSALGEEFRSAREARGLTLSDVAEQIHIRSVYLNAIEHEDWGAIGAPVYVRGFIRTYARFLGLDGEAAVARFNQMIPATERPAAAPVTHAVDRERSGPSVWAIGGIVVALLLVLFAGYEWYAYSQGTDVRTAAAPGPQTQPTAPSGGSAPSAFPVAASAPTATPAVLPKHELAIRLSEASWLRVTVDGATLAEGLYPAGTRKSFTGSVAVVRVGNAGGVQILVDGRPTPALGKNGDVAEQRYTL
ncbi:XRE family transcriptional regulator [Vulcanimicrobium alpinum]|uniref:XRE family transcriptional regulator n=1 Tax=Vulcanimicrobium alpinum TaxID=3016050 RepID=A0AAN2C8Z9_UNVUL|nr:RodZ domain-containing protein [Vulcanimicrobium alpinum]BDE05501.1 XRE family transcriptional regulator [Vulcanimicrobium alpinum]